VAAAPVVRPSPEFTATETQVVPASYTGGHSCPTCTPGFAALPPQAYGPASDCLDDGYLSPEELVCNGGDEFPGVIVQRDWRVKGLNAGDTVVHFDTQDGHTRVAKSNDVCLYAPRFAAVRKIFGPVINEQHEIPANLELPSIAKLSTDVGEPTTVVQPLQPGRKHIVTSAQRFRERIRDVGMDNALQPVTARDQMLPYENLSLIRHGVYDQTEAPRLAQALQAAIVWTRDQAPQILVDGRPAVQTTGVLNLQSIYTYELPPGKPCVQIVKIASRCDARPGETVDFTLRFDNLGDQVVGNVTIIDRLHDRLEYVPDSQSCSLPARFSTEDDDGASRILRWEISDPLKVGEGGIIRFRCLVR
jgi:uncharacterized repeat protein (TIGR01451 family)